MMATSQEVVRWWEMHTPNVKKWKNENEGENTSLQEKTQDQAQKNVTAPSSDLIPTLNHANSAS